MFQKPTFGNTSGFGSFNAGASTSSPFGGFKTTPGSSAFGAAPSFGANAAAQPAAGGGLFGATNTTGGLFGNTATPTATSAFGANTSAGFGFGQPSTSGGLFGAGNTSGGLFGANQQQQNQSAFGAKPAAYGFGATPIPGTSGTGLFGGTSTSSGLFGQQTTSMGGGGLFGNTTAGGFGQNQPTGTGHVKYSPVVGTDVVLKGGNSQNINIKNHCITSMKEYETKSLEELRLEDYVAGRKGPSNPAMFSGFQAQTENKPLALFGGTSFGQPATTSAPGVFGGGMGTNTFGQTNTFAFGGTSQPAQSNLFGANKPAFGATSTPGTGLFGTTTTQAAPAFGTASNSFGFGNNTQNQSTTMFGAKPATSAFGTTPAAGTSAFGGFGTNNAGTGLFGSKPASTAAPAFGTAAPAFGSLSGAFGTNTTTTGGGLFGGTSAFGTKPAQPTFGFGATQSTGGLGAAGGLNNAFQTKPTGSLFPSFSTSNTSMFNTAGQNTQPLSFGTTNTGIGGLGGGMNFGGTSTLGGSTLGGLGTFGAANNNAFNTSNLVGASAAGNVHEQILSLAARPYGDSPLFKDLLPDSTTTTEDVLKPTNPAAVKAILDNSGYRINSPDATRLKVQPKASDHSHDKKSLFDGLEESDATLEDKLSLKPSRKRLVLRPQQNRIQEPPADNHANKNGSMEEQPSNVRDASDGPTSTTAEPLRSATRAESASKRSSDYGGHLRGVNTDLEDSSEKHSSWLGSSRLSWSDSREKPVGSEPTPRIYPVLEKEPSTVAVPERRASWLTTKPLRKPLSSNPDTIENSVRELRADFRLNDKENIDNVSVSEEDNVAPVESPPHPTGVKLTRPGYYTIPSLDEMIPYMRADGTCVVPNLIIGRKNYGNVYYDCEIDVAGMDLDQLVHFLHKEMIIYPDDTNKPAVGQGLNRRAIVTIDHVWPRDKTEKRPITDPDRLMKMDYESKLRRVCDKHDTKFIEYRPRTGSWVFRVEHFSKYGLTDSDEEDDPVPEVIKRQLIKDTLQKASVTMPPKPAAGLGGMSALVSDETLMGFQQTSMNLLNGTSKAFEMDTTEDSNAAEPVTFYPDTTNVYTIKSPTGELARLEHRSSHHVQLMKASLYAEPELEDDVSISTGDQLVPSPSAVARIPAVAPSTVLHAEPVEETPHVPHTEEMQMRPLILRPHTVVLRYHRKVPPFKHTIAGRLNANCIADMAVSRARHCRVGFGPRRTMVYVSTRDAITDLPPVAELSELSKYVDGRSPEDWSEPLLTMLAIAGSDKRDRMHEALSSHLEALLAHSTYIEADDDSSPHLMVTNEPMARLELLNKFLGTAEKHAADKVAFGVSGAYAYEVFKLCEALWAADLNNNGMAGTDDISIVSRHNKLIEWLTTAVKIVTDEDVSRPQQCEPEDESDRHSAVVWKLLLGGRVVQACKTARDNGDLQMAALIAQASGDPVFRSLISRQLYAWRSDSAEQLISTHRLYALRLLAGDTGPRDGLADVDWLRAFNATARYLTPQVPTLDRIVAKYESFFKEAEVEDAEPMDLAHVAEDKSTGMQYPVPPYQAEYDISLEYETRERRVLDLRYELLHARATNSRPKLHPMSYTPDPLDYSLSFLLGTWFGNPTTDSITGVADQLEAHGSWHLAVQALMYLPDVKVRDSLIRGVLSRNAPCRVESAYIQSQVRLVMTLRVPYKWLLVGQAHRAKYEHLPEIEAKYLAEAGYWNEAHKVLVEELLPKAVLSDKIEEIAPLLEKMNEAAKRHEISDWESGGQAIYQYKELYNEIRTLVSVAERSTDGRASITTAMESMRARVYHACRSLGAVRPTTPIMCAARAEMSSRLLQLATAAGESPGQLTILLKALKLPPDCRVAAQQKITSELAEEASELCLESPTSSPVTMSSIHRTQIRMDCN